VKERSQFVPCEEQMALWPDVSGNTINGLGETTRRNPTPVMWHPPEIIAHGPVQTWFWEQGVKQPEIFALRSERQRVIAEADAPIAAERVDMEPAIFAARIAEVARAGGADLVGIVQTDPSWVFEGYTFDFPWIVMLGVAMDPEQLRHAPEVPAAVEVVTKYTKGWKVARHTSNWIREQGWRAQPHSGPDAGPVLAVPAALAAGFGQLGKHGSIISREFGPSFRLAAVFTDVPLVSGQPVDIGVEDFCNVCRRCVDDCPPGAIRHEQQIVRGERKWYVDFDKCFPYFAETHGCAVCLGVCPWTKAGRAPQLSERMLRRRLAGTTSTPRFDGAPRG
jgi:NAD-dependent dihydropyrimidine dehydrogenase PreA subunit